jgi:hypothetical protein
MLFPKYNGSFEDLTPEEVERLKEACLKPTRISSSTIIPDTYHPVGSMGVYQLLGILRDRISYINDPTLTEEGFKILSELETEIRAAEIRFSNRSSES